MSFPKVKSAEFLDFMKLAKAGDPEAQYKVGECYENDSNSDASSSYFDKDDPEMKFVSRCVYANYPNDSDSSGDEEDQQDHWKLEHEETALVWYFKAANQDIADAQVKMGQYFVMKYMNEEAKEWFTKAANQNHPEAQFRLGELYEDRFDDDQMAVEWYTKAANQNYPEAQCKIGAFYESGDCGMEQNFEKAVQWYTKAAKQNDADGQYWLAWCFHFGKGVEVDPDKALRLYEQAKANDERTISVMADERMDEVKDMIHERNLERAQTGDVEAQYNVAMYYGFTYTYSKGSDEKAFEWFAKAAHQNHRDAQFRLAEAYRFGRGVEKSEEGTFEWYTKAADLNHPDAQCNLGYYYQEGDGPAEKDLDKAFELFTKAANQNHGESQVMVGSYYNEGWAVKENLEKALEWYERAKENEDTGLYSVELFIEKVQKKIKERQPQGEALPNEQSHDEVQPNTATTNNGEKDSTANNNNDDDRMQDFQYVESLLYQTQKENEELRRKVEALEQQLKQSRVESAE